MCATARDREVAHGLAVRALLREPLRRNAALGGRARAEALPPERRRAQALKAGKASGERGGGLSRSRRSPPRISSRACVFVLVLLRLGASAGFAGLHHQGQGHRHAASLRRPGGVNGSAGVRMCGRCPPSRSPERDIGYRLGRPARSLRSPASRSASRRAIQVHDVPDPLFDLVVGMLVRLGRRAPDHLGPVASQGGPQTPLSLVTPRRRQGPPGPRVAVGMRPR
jgi:hypothetical protein